MPYNTNEALPHYVSAAGVPPREHAALLAVERRRLALDVLCERTTSLEIGDLAAEVAAREAGLDAPPAAAPVDLTIDLHHVHLPKLAEAGVLEYDPDTREVEPIARARAEEPDPAEWSADGANERLGVHLQEHVVAYFDASADETATIDDLTRYAATRFPDTVERSPERIQLRLHHAVLPRLVDAGVIDYDPRTSTVRCRRDFA